MDIDRMCEMLELLTEQVKSEIDNGLEHIDTCEMGQAIDMIKDLSEAIYYRKITISENNV